MKRKYNLSKAVTQEQADKAMEEMKKITGFGEAEFTEDLKGLIVTADDDKITHVSKVGGALNCAVPF